MHLQKAGLCLPLKDLGDTRGPSDPTGGLLFQTDTRILLLRGEGEPEHLVVASEATLPVPAWARQKRGSHLTVHPQKARLSGSGRRDVDLEKTVGEGRACPFGVTLTSLPDVQHDAD